MSRRTRRCFFTPFLGVRSGSRRTRRLNGVKKHLKPEPVPAWQPVPLPHTPIAASQPFVMNQYLYPSPITVDDLASQHFRPSVVSLQQSESGSGSARGWTLELLGEIQLSLVKTKSLMAVSFTSMAINKQHTFSFPLIWFGSIIQVLALDVQTQIKGLW